MKSYNYMHLYPIRVFLNCRKLKEERKILQKKHFTVTYYIWVGFEAVIHILEHGIFCILFFKVLFWLLPTHSVPFTYTLGL